MIHTAVFPVAGKGTRFLPATKSTPKEMSPIIHRPLIQYAIDEALAAGAKKLVFIISDSKLFIKNFLRAVQSTIGSASTEPFTEGIAIVGRSDSSTSYGTEMITSIDDLFSSSGLTRQHESLIAGVLSIGPFSGLTINVSTDPFEDKSKMF